MQPRVPRLDWIGKVLADPPGRESADRLPLRLVADARASGQGVIRPEAFTLAARRRREAAKQRPSPKAAR